MKIVSKISADLSGRVTVPGDKSISHRALMFSAISDGTCEILGLGTGRDNIGTQNAVAQLGIDVERQGERVVVHGKGLDGMTGAGGVIDCGNSGTTIRLLTGLLCGQSFSTTLTGDASLVKRPMARVTKPLSRMGALISGSQDQGNTYPPLVVHPAALTGIEYQMPIASAQVKSALILAALYAKGTTTIVESGPARNHTELMLASIGAPILVQGNVITVTPSGWDRRLKAARIEVPGDPSSAAFIVCAAVLCNAERVTISDVCVNPTRTGFVDILGAMGILVEKECQRMVNGDLVADLTVSRNAAALHRPTEISGEVVIRAIDEIPILALVAATLPGTTVFRDAHELRVKESDRIASTCTLLSSLGVKTDSGPDWFSVEGQPSRQFLSASVDSFGDHRIAMTAAVAGLRSDGEVIVNNADNVETSFPTFVSCMNELGAQIEAG